MLATENNDFDHTDGFYHNIYRIIFHSQQNPQKTTINNMWVFINTMLLPSPVCASNRLLLKT